MACHDDFPVVLDSEGIGGGVLGLEDRYDDAPVAEGGIECAVGQLARQHEGGPDGPGIAAPRSACYDEAPVCLERTRIGVGVTVGANVRRDGAARPEGGVEDAPLCCGRCGARETEC